MAYENNECITKGHKSVWKCLVDMKDTEIEGRASYQNKGGEISNKNSYINPTLNGISIGCNPIGGALG